MTKCLFLIYRNLNVQQIIADGPAYGLFKGNEIYPITDISTNIILCWRIEFQCKWFPHTFSPKVYSLIQNNINGNIGHKFQANFVMCEQGLNFSTYFYAIDFCSKLEKKVFN